MMQSLLESIVQRALTLVALSVTALLYAARLLDRVRRTASAGHAPMTGLLHSVSVTGGTWWYPRDLLPHSGTASHSYFQRPGEGRLLAVSLAQSGGRDALLHAAHFRLAILRTSWAGLRISSIDKEADRELSSGTGGLPTRLVHIRDACVALQRNDTNYGHFITEILPSIVAWESSSLFPCKLIVAESTFAEPLLRMIGFEGVVTTVPAPSLVLATDVTVLRLLPAGIYHPPLLQEVARRARVASAGCAIQCRKVVFLTRSVSATRRLTNETEVIRVIQEVFPDVDVFRPAEAPVEEQVARMADARVVIPTFGAQAMNMLWATTMEHFVEITFYGARKPCFAELAKALGASASFVTSNARTPGDHYADHECDIGSLRTVLRGLAISKGDIQ